MSRMKIDKQERPRVKAECLRMLLGLRLDVEQEDLVWEIVDTYLPLGEKEDKTFQRELATIASEAEADAMEFMTREQRGWTRGLQEGTQIGRAKGVQEMALRQICRRFGSTDASLQERIQQLSLTQLEQLTEDLLDFATLSDVSAWLDQNAPDATTH